MRYVMASIVVGILLLAMVPASSAGSFFDVSDGGNVGIGTTAAGALLDVARPATTSNTELIDIRANGFTQTISGALTNARFNQFNQYTLNAATAQTVTNGTTLHIAGPPTGGGAGPASITTGSALRIAAGAVANTTNAYGLYVDAPTGATNNYAAVFPSGNVGIGTTGPLSPLDVRSSSSYADTAMIKIAFFGSNDATGPLGILIRHSASGSRYRADIVGTRYGVSGNDIDINTGDGSGGITVQYQGNVGLGIGNPGNILTVHQNSATDPIADAWTTYSSIRWKEHIVPFSGALDKIERLRTVYFDWKSTQQRDLGMIAEEVGAVLPEVVAYEPNGKDAKSIDYGRMTAVLVQAIKEQQVQIRDLQKEIAALKHSQ